MIKSDVSKLKDKDLQLRYYLGGLKETMSNSGCHYWKCDIECSCALLSEDIDLTNIKEFIKKHNISNERFLLLAYNYLTGNFVYYHNKPSELITELAEILKPLSLNRYEKKEDNNLYDKTLEKLMEDVKNPHAFYVNDIRDFIKKYNLTDNDFITIAKTWINQRFWKLHIHYDKATETFPSEINSIINEHNLFIERDMLDKYILIEKLLQSNPSIAKQLIQDELEQLDINSEEKIKEIVLQKK